MCIAMDVWATKASAVPASERDSPGDMHATTFEEHIAGKRKAKRTSATYTAPFHEQRNAAASWLAPNVDNLDKEL